MQEVVDYFLCLSERETETNVVLFSLFVSKFEKMTNSVIIAAMRTRRADK